MTHVTLTEEHQKDGGVATWEALITAVGGKRKKLSKMNRSAPSGFNSAHQVLRGQKALSNESEHLLHTWLKPSLKVAEPEGKFKSKTSAS